MPAMADRLTLYNTLTRRGEPFVPADPRTITFYSCGPTVYDDAHIGNFRSFLAADLLRESCRSGELAFDLDPDAFLAAGINVKLDNQHAIGKRYARHDEIGTPYCLTIDGQTAEDETVTIRYRDDRRQDRIKISAAVDVVREALREGRE